MARDIDGTDERHSEIPQKLRIDEGGHEPTACGVYVDVDIQSFLFILCLEEVIESLHVLILAGIGGAEDSADQNRVLVHEVHSLFGINHEALRGAVQVPFLHFEVARGFLPTDLDCGIHDEVGLIVRLSGRLTRICGSGLWSVRDRFNLRRNKAHFASVVSLQGQTR